MIRFTLYKSFREARVLDSLPGVMLLKSDRIIDRFVGSSTRGHLTFYGEVRVIYNKLKSKPLVIADMTEPRYLKYERPHDITPRLAEGRIKFLSRLTYEKFLRDCEESDRVNVLRTYNPRIEKLIIENSSVYDKYLISRSYYIGL